MPDTFFAPESNFVWVLFGVVIALFVVSILVRGFFAIKRFVKIIGKGYRKNPKPESLDLAHLRALNTGAINSEQTMYFCDSLATGETKTKVLQNLYANYAIRSHANAVEQIESLLYSGHRSYFDIIKESFVNSDKSSWKQQCKDLFDREAGRATEFMTNLDEAFDALKNEGFVGDRSEIATLDITAWDTGRAVMLARSCVEAKYLTADEGWIFIERAYEISAESYENWEDFARGYCVGRAMWGGNSVTLGGIFTIAKGLLNDEESPWKQTSFK